MGERRSIPYRQRIVEYCERNGVVVPSNFDAPKSSDKFVIVDVTDNPPTLVPRSTFLSGQVIGYVTDSKNRGRQFRILDFKRCCELTLSESGKLLRGPSFDGKSRGEIERGSA